MFQMVPEFSTSKIENLLILVDEHRVSDHKTFLSAYKMLDTTIENRDVKRPIAILADSMKA